MAESVLVQAGYTVPEGGDAVDDAEAVLEEFREFIDQVTPEDFS